jgi:hypothetical protein
MAVRREYRYLIETHGEPGVEGASPTHTIATIGYFAYPWRQPLAPATAAWMAEVLERLFLPSSRTISICLLSSAQPGSDRAALVDWLCGAASAMAGGPGDAERAYRLPSHRLGCALFSQLFSDSYRSFILFDPSSPPDLEPRLDAVRRYYAAMLHPAESIAYVPLPSPQWLDRLLRRSGLALGARITYPPEDAFPDHDRSSHILWRIANEVDGVAFGFPDDERVGLEIRAKGCRVAALHEVLSQSAERHGIRAVRVGTLSDLVYHW